MNKNEFSMWAAVGEPMEDDMPYFIYTGLLGKTEIPLIGETKEQVLQLIYDSHFYGPEIDRVEEQKTADDIESKIRKVTVSWQRND